MLMPKMMFRRLMLRKGVALLLALIFVISTVGLYMVSINIATESPLIEQRQVSFYIHCLLQLIFVS